MITVNSGMDAEVFEQFIDQLIPAEQTVIADDAIPDGTDEQDSPL